MKNIAAIILFAAILCSGCSDRNGSATMKSFSPATIVQTVAKAHKIELAKTGSGQGGSSGHGSSDWHYYSDSRVGDLEAVVGEIYRAFEGELGRLGAHVHGHSEDKHSLLVYGLTYTHGSREGTLRVISAGLEKGAAIDVFLDEHPK